MMSFEGFLDKVLLIALLVRLLDSFMILRMNKVFRGKNYEENVCL
jgi:hypothetical protein